MYQLLLGLTSVLMRHNLSKNAELLVLRQENAVLRRQVARVRYTPADRAWLTVIAAAAPSPLGCGLPSLTPATILTWHHRLPSTDFADDSVVHDAHA